MHSLFYRLYCFIQKNKIPFLIFGILGIGLLSLFSSNIKLEEDITKLIPSNEQSQTLKKVLETVEFSDKIVINIATGNSSNADSLVAYATNFIDSTQAKLNPYISEIQGKIEPKQIFEMYGFVFNNIPLFLDENDYEAIDKRLDSIPQRVEGSYKTLLSPAGLMVKKQLIQDPLQVTFLGLEKLKQLRVDQNFEVYQNFLVTKNHKNLLLFLDPVFPTNETEKNTVFVNKLERIVANLNQKYPQVNASVFGATIYAVANAKQIKQDIQLTVSIAMGILFLILIFFYRNVLTPIILFIPTIIGALFALTFLYFFENKISAVSLGIGSILIGVTLDYSLHILTHIRNSISVQKLYEDVTMPVLMSGLTTALAFICLLFVESEALNELGIFASISVMGAAIFALLLIPQLYKIKPQSLKPKKKTSIDLIASYSFHTNKIFLFSLAGLFFLGLFIFNEVGFNHDIADLNYQPKKLIQAEKDLAAITDQEAKSIYMVSYGKDLNSALSANQKLFQKLKQEKIAGKIQEFSSIGGVVLSTEDQERKIADWNNFWTLKRKQKVKAELISEGMKRGFKEDAFQPFFNLLEQKFVPIAFSDYEKTPSLYLDEFVSTDKDIATVVSLVKIDESYSNEFIESFRDFKNVLPVDRKQMNEGFLGNLHNKFNSLIGFSTLAVFLILLFSYRNLELSVLTFSPIAVTWVIVLGVMDIANIQFNIFNIMICTFIFGMGVDYSIFMTKAMRKRLEFGVNELATFRSSIILSVITTMLGIGVLIFAKHPALRSIALVSIIGIFTAALVSFVIHPFLFQLFIIDRSRKGLSPLKLRQTLHATFSFLYFGLGAFLLSTISALLIPLFPVSKPKKMLFFHRVVSKFMKSVLYTNPFIRKRIFNLQRETFQKQCIIIANHTSFLDVLAIGMLHPKLIYLVNDWVYHSPVFGKAVKLAGFFPVSDGIEGGVAHLREKIRQGYSLIAFPEGSRSQTQRIRRFHKGAFYLSEQLKLDLLPILIHGNAHVLPKGDFVIHDGEINLNILKRIPWNSDEYGSTYAAKAKNFRKAFSLEFEKLQSEIEEEGYYRKKLLANYSYKTCLGEAKHIFDTQKKHFLEISDLLKSKDKVLHLGSGKGILDFYLCYKNPSIKITGYEEIPTDLQISQNCYSAKREDIRFVGKDLSLDEDFNVLIISKKTDFLLKSNLEFIKFNLYRCIVLCPNFDTKFLLDSGFEIEMQKEGIQVLTKK